MDRFLYDRDLRHERVKISAHVYSHSLVFSNCVKNGKFPHILKYDDITHVFKIGDPTDKCNCRPINTLLNFSKTFLETWRDKLNKGQNVGTITVDLSKALDTLNHKLLFKKNYNLMVSIKNHFLLLKAILLTENKGLR